MWLNNFMPTKNPTITMIFPDELLEKVEDYRYENRIPSRTEAIRQLIEMGLEKIGNDSSPQKQSKK